MSPSASVSEPDRRALRRWERKEHLDETWLDVTQSIRSLCVGGRLVIEASNDIQGDPLEGVQKILRVEFIHGGRHYEMSVNEYEILSVP